MNNFFQSKYFTYLFYGIIALALVLFIFRAGMFVGFKKASFIYEHDMRSARFESGRFSPPPFGNDPFTASHGTFGIISSITSSSTFNVIENNGIEKTVFISASTSIRQATGTAAIEGLHINDRVVVIGNPDANGQIQAQLVRIYPTN